MVAETRIIGIGSPFGADRVGWQVVEGLSTRCPADLLERGTLSLQTLDRPAAALLEAVAGAERVYLVDAMLSGAEPGSWRRLTVDEVINDDSLLSSHGFGVSQALALAESLNRLPPQLQIYAIEVPAGLSDDPRLKRAQNEVADALIADLC